MIKGGWIMNHLKAVEIICEWIGNGKIEIINRLLSLQWTKQSKGKIERPKLLCEWIR